MANLSEETILATFDHLVSEGVIMYEEYSTIKQDCDGFPMEFRICPSLRTKPHTITSALSPHFNKSQKWGPGSDMYLTDPRLIIARPNGTHDLALNLFCVDRPQYVCLTQDSYKRQYESLDLDDVKVAMEMLRLRDVYVIFNCGERAGCSRVHKHLQGLRGPPMGFEVMIKEPSTVPFKFFSRSTGSDSFENAPASEVLENYLALLAQARAVLGVSETDVCPHNVVMWKGWMIVIPRRSSAVGLASANAAGMMGSVWVSEKRFVDEWLEHGCRKVLGELGVPRG